MSPNRTEGASTTTARARVRWRRFRRRVRDKLTWSRLYRTTSYLKSALWTVPIIAIIIELLIAPILHALDAWLGWRLAGLEVAGAQALYQTVITLTLSFLVFTFGSLLVAIQIAGGQLTPRIIATTLLRDNVVRYSVGLLAAARRHDGAIEFLPQVGDFVATDEPLFTLYGGAVAIDDQVLRTTVAFGPERTLEQDPMFAFRILVDIALKALSPAINDPTTGVLAIDQVHRLLRVLGGRKLRGEVIPDAIGRPRVIFRTPNWEDFVHIACSEIRACGANNVQIARRLRAMLENLVRTLPEHRHPALRQELDKLDRTIRALYSLPEDLALAGVPDPQGLGGSARAQLRGAI